jgi:SHOCT-like protein
MNENRRQILEMLAAGKITADEAEKLIAALEPASGRSAGEFTGRIAGSNGRQNNDKDTPVKTRLKYLRVLVESSEKGGPTTVNVRVPMQLLRAGVRLATLIPQQAHEQFDATMNKHGVPLTLSQIKPENLEELIDHLEDLSVDVDAKDEKAKVRVFCE